MGLLNKLLVLLGVEPEYDVSALKKSSGLMDEELYWQIIQKSLIGNKDQFDQEEFIVKALKRLTPEDIIGFKLRTNQLLHDMYSLKMLAAAYIITVCDNQEDFADFGSWVISKGRDVYYNAVQDPETLVAFENGEDFFEFLGFGDIPQTAFKEKTGQELDKWIAYGHGAIQEGLYPYIQHGLYNEEDDAVLRNMFPKLFDKFYEE